MISGQIDDVGLTVIGACAEIIGRIRRQGLRICEKYPNGMEDIR